MSDLYWTTENGVKVFEDERDRRWAFPLDLQRDFLLDHTEVEYEKGEWDIDSIEAWVRRLRKLVDDGWEIEFLSEGGETFSLCKSRPLTDEERVFRKRWIKEYTEAGGIIVDPTRPASLKRQVPFEQSTQPLTEGKTSPDSSWDINNV